MSSTNFPECASSSMTDITTRKENPPEEDDCKIFQHIPAPPQPQYIPYPVVVPVYQPQPNLIMVKNSVQSETPVPQTPMPPELSPG